MVLSDGKSIESVADTISVASSNFNPPVARRISRDCMQQIYSGNWFQNISALLH